MIPKTNTLYSMAGTAALLALSSAVSGAVLTVGPGGTYTTIQAALDAAEAADCNVFGSECQIIDVNRPGFAGDLLC